MTCEDLEADVWNSTDYFKSLGYKYIEQYHTLIVKDFQRHAGIKADGIIGPITKAKIDYYNADNFCPEVFEPIKPYIPYTDVRVESLCNKGLVGLGKWFNFYSRYYGFDVLHNLAHAILESASGTSAIANTKNNLYGFRAYDSSPMESAYGFESKERCIEKWSWWFNETYLLPTGKYYNGNNENGVNVKYASSPIAGINKSFIVRDLRKESNDMQLTQNFVLSEFDCKDGTPVPEHLIDNVRLVATELQKVRDYFGKPIKVNSGYRTAEYNKKVGGSPTSYHLLALAADTKPLWYIDIGEYFKVVKKLTNFMGYGIGTGWIHLDLRKVYTVWLY